MLARILANFYKTRHRLRRFGRVFAVKPGERVLDIGAGDSPFAPADVICEKFPWDDTERTARFQHDRPLVVGDVEALPFCDQAFDFIYCCHVLEHAFHPERAIAELTRVGRRGYIEMPTSYFEKAVRSEPSHLWFVRLDAGTLVFTPKPRGVLDSEINAHHEKLHEKDPLYDAFYYARLYPLYHVGIFWEKEIAFRIDGEAVLPGTRTGDAFRKGHAALAAQSRKPERGASLADTLKRWVYRRRARAGLNLEALLACPHCRGRLQTERETLICQNCAARYPVVEGTPILLKEAAQNAAAV